MGELYLKLIGISAAICTTSCYFPQFIKIIKTRKTRDISLGMYIVLSIGIFLWLVYGILLKDLPLISANSVTLILTLGVLILKLIHT
ncbi:MAG: SemiSWEET transporter [bacterium]